jgi:colanic acid/amylovoran biosynthesis glycosyltransferase
VSDARDEHRPLRVAFLLPTFPELSNTFVLNQITGLIDRGHHVDLFALERKPFEGAHPAVARYGLEARMRHLPVPSSRVRRVASVLRALARPGAWHPATWDALAVHRHGREALALVHAHTVVSFLVNGPYDVLHAQFGNLGPAARRLVAHGATSAKLVASFRGADVTTHLPNDPRRFEDLFRHGDLFLPVSRAFRDRIVAAGAPADRTVVHHSGIDLRLFPFVPRTAPTGRSTVLFVGRLTEKKGLRYALEALDLAVARGIDVGLDVIGDGPLRPAIEQQVAHLGLGDRVRLLGARPHGEVAAAMRVAQVLVAPSIVAASGDQEGIPNVVKEAMATGLPVVSTLHGGVPELVDDGVSGYLVAERDAAALADRLADLLGHPDRWAAFGRAARQKIEDEFDSERLNDELVALYRGIVTGRARA